MVAAGLAPIAIGAIGVPLIEVLVPAGQSGQTAVSELLDWASDSFGRGVLSAFFAIYFGLVLVHVAGAVLSSVQSADLRRKRKRVADAITAPAK